MRKRAKVWECVSGCVRERKREKVCCLCVEEEKCGSVVSVCVRERKRDKVCKKRKCVCVCVREEERV